MTDHLGADFERRLRRALNRTQPPTPRPAQARFSQGFPTNHRFGGMKPAVAAACALAVLMAAATAVSGSPNPAVWTQRTVTTVQSVTHMAASSPTPEPEKAPNVQSNAAPQTDASQTQKPTQESPEPSGNKNQDPAESPDASSKSTHAEQSSKWTSDREQSRTETRSRSD